MAAAKCRKVQVSKPKLFPANSDQPCISVFHMRLIGALVAATMLVEAAPTSTLVFRGAAPLLRGEEQVLRDSAAPSWPPKWLTAPLEKGGVLRHRIAIPSMPWRRGQQLRDESALSALAGKVVSVGAAARRA